MGHDHLLEMPSFQLCSAKFIVFKNSYMHNSASLQVVSKQEMICVVLEAGIMK